MQATQAIIFLVIALVICIGLFLILRMFNLWYWKIEERVQMQKETNMLLKEIIRTLQNK
ncbi:MAG TPA: hypothetical protein VNX01_02710 [Bacteroidia bacterium]|nr:hypothetical protein [Bacteroidia bacterium]